MFIIKEVSPRSANEFDIVKCSVHTARGWFTKNKEFKTKSSAARWISARKSQISNLEGYSWEIVEY